MKRENFKAGKIQTYNRKTERDNLLWKIQKKIKDADEQPLKYYEEKYGNIPPWILVKALTFGELLVLYKLSTTDIKENVIKILVGIEPDKRDKEFFAKSMELFNKFRNRSAHGGRMYNYKTNIESPYLGYIHPIFNISKKNYNAGNDRSDNAAFILALLRIHRNDPCRILEYIVQLDFALKKYKETQPVNISSIYNALGLPFDYYERFLEWYKK